MIDAPRILDLRETTNHPISLRYSEIFSAALLTGFFSHGRSQPGVCLAENAPFVETAKVGLAYGLSKEGALEKMRAYLRQYYETVTPSNAAEWLGISEDSKLAKFPPWGAVFPWRARTIESYQQAFENAAMDENKAVGRDVGISDGWLFCGPVSNEKIEIEAERLLYVLRRIEKSGYQRSDEIDGDVKATALVGENSEWRWLITAGNHRASAAAALGMKSIPVRVNLVISRCDAAYWKHVVDGVFSQAAAVDVFDNYFNATPPKVLAPWLDRNLKIDNR